MWCSKACSYKLAWYPIPSGFKAHATAKHGEIRRPRPNPLPGVLAAGDGTTVPFSKS
jgi:hypothetical protein